MSAAEILESKPTLSTSERIVAYLPVVLCTIILLLLYCGIPYASGYADHRVSIFRFATVLWTGKDAAGRAGDWQHCFLVPLGIAVIVFSKRESLRLDNMKSSWFGLGITIIGLAFYWLGYRADNIYIGYGSLQILSAGLLLWFAGWEWFRTLFFAWIFLGFIYPLTFLDNVVAFPLRMIMSKGSSFILNHIGVPVVLQGTGILSAPDASAGLAAGEKFSVDVADPCSGIRSLFALMMVSVLYANFTLKSWWQKWILFLSAIPLAVLGNLARILMLTLGTLAFGSEFAIGRDALTDPSGFHMFAGYLVFAVALIGMVNIAGLFWLGNRRRQKKSRSGSQKTVARDL